MFPKIIIISGGRLGKPAFFRERLFSMGEIKTICCDGGIRHLRDLKIEPDVIVGDMDSAEKSEIDKYADRGVKILRYPAGKDATDTQLALEYALKLKPAEIEIWSALGGRIDHALANLFLLGLGVRAGIKTILIDEYCETFVVEKEAAFSEAMGQTVSLFAVNSNASGIVLHGFLYPLNHETLEMNNSRGISNIIVDSPATISVSAGSLLVVRYWRKNFFPEAV